MAGLYAAATAESLLAVAALAFKPLLYAEPTPNVGLRCFLVGLCLVHFCAKAIRCWAKKETLEGFLRKKMG